MRYLLGLLLTGISLTAQANMLERELGAYNLSLGTTPSRSMAQGLVQPQSAGTFHGGLDLAHESGWYLGQWAPSLGVLPGHHTEWNSYAGYRHRFDGVWGYEVGAIHYSSPGLSHLDSQDLYAGLSLAERRLGLALSNHPSRLDSTLLADLGRLDALGLSVTLKYGHHLLDAPTVLSDGRQVRLFNDWSLNLSRPWLGIDLTMSYSDSSLRDDECAAYVGRNRHCESWFSFEASRPLF
jgi:uncharacterized protein (TIGR02001 family)